MIASTRASVVVVAYEQRELTWRCLGALQRCLGQRLETEFELVLVDNGSSASTARSFSSAGEFATVVRLERNAFFAGGSNAGAHVARGRTLVFLNNDTEVLPGAVERLVSEASKPGIGAVGCRLLYPDGRIQHAGWGVLPPERDHAPFHFFRYEPAELVQAHASYDVRAVTGAALAIPRDLFRSLGGFDKSYRNGWEDIDLCERVRAAGRRVRYCGEVAIVHREGATSRRNYSQSGNAERFRRRWGAPEDDAARVLGLFGASVRPSLVSGDADEAAATAVLRAPLLALSPVAQEARAMLSLLSQHVPVAAREDSRRCLTPALDPAVLALIASALERVAGPDALEISFSAQENPTRVVRTARPASRDGQIVWSATPLSSTSPGGCRFLPPSVAPPPPAAVGDGVFATLPTHRPALAAAVIAALRRFSPRRIRLLPTVRTDDALKTARRLPHAEVLPPVADVDAVAPEWLDDCSVAVCVGLGDPFERLALRTAAAGLAVVVDRRDGPAAAIAGAVVTADACSQLEATLRVVLGPERDPDALRRRVAAECSPAVLAARVRALLSEAAQQPAQAGRRRRAPAAHRHARGHGVPR